MCLLIFANPLVFLWLSWEKHVPGSYFLSTWLQSEMEKTLTLQNTWSQAHMKHSFLNQLTNSWVSVFQDPDFWGGLLSIFNAVIAKYYKNKIK